MSSLARQAAEQLANIFRDEYEVLYLLSDAGLASAEIPPLGGRAPLLYWQVVIHLVEQGVIHPDELTQRKVATGLAAVLQQAWKRRPNNPELARLFALANAPNAGALAPPSPPKILVLGASPKRESPLRVNKELKAIRDAVGRRDARVRFEVRDHLSTEPNELVQVLTETRPTVLHFSGHNDPRPDAPTGAIILEGPDGGPAPLEAKVLARVLRYVNGTGDKVQAIVLNACASVTVARELGGLADVIVCTRHSLNDDVAVACSEGFYSGLARGEPVGRAIEGGRVQALLFTPSGSPDRVVGSGPLGGAGASAWGASEPDSRDVDNIIPWTTPPERDLDQVFIPARVPGA
jgi:hypothetical protein